jgi:A/G-specific adenine glycosylase
MTIPEFCQIVWEYYRTHARSFPWRETTDPYRIVVSEFMLQQTQTERVLPKYEKFIQELPDWQALADCDTQTLLRLWQGLGYNRRALNLKRLAQQVVAQHGGALPDTEVELRALPGIGPYTAGAIRAFAFNQAVVMIETNIRRAFLYHFFPDQEGVADRQLTPLIEASVSQDSPRYWYYALMDYGSWLGRTQPNANRRSRHYTRQSTFEGSLRQLRGAVVRYLAAQPETGMTELLQETNAAPERLEKAVAGLGRDGFLIKEGERVRIL